MADGAVPPEESSKLVSRYFGTPSDFSDSDRLGVDIDWESLKNLGKEFPFDTQVFFGNFPCSEKDAEGQPFTFKSPLRVKALNFQGHVTQLQFEVLVVPLANLKTLDLHLVTLGQLTLKHTLIRLVNLTNLKVSSANFGPRDAEKLDMTQVFTNAIFLIHLNFPALKYLALSLPTLPSQERALTEGVLRALVRNKCHLKSLSLESPFPLMEAAANGSEGGPFELSPKFEQDLKGLKLTTFHYSITLPTTSTSFWRKFSLGLSQLEYFHFWVECSGVQFPPASLEDILKNNRATLETLAVNQIALREAKKVGLEPGPILNGTAFQHCSKLKTLYIMGNFGAEARQRSSPPSFKYFNLLPYSIQSLRIHNMMLSVSDTKFIANNLQNLKHLELVNIGEEGSLGLSFEHLSTLMSKKGLDRLEVVGGVNRSSLQVKSSDRSWKNIAKVLFQSQMSTWFRASRDPVTNAFEMVDVDSEGHSDAEGSYTSSSSSSREGCVVSDLDLLTPRSTIGKARVREEESRELNSNARTLYGNVKFDLATSSDHVNQNQI